MRGGDTLQRITVDGWVFPEENGQLPWQDSVVWRNLLKRDFLEAHDLCFRYPQITHGEDGLFLFEVLREEPSTLETGIACYGYRIHTGSAETSDSPRSRKKRLYSHMRVLEVLNGYLQKDGASAQNTANRLVSFLWLTLFELTREEVSQIRPIWKQLKSMGLVDNPLPEGCTLGRADLAQSRWLDSLCCRLHTGWGFWLVWLMRRLRNILEGKR